MLHGQAAGDAFAAEIRDALIAGAEVAARFGGRIVERADEWAFPHLVVDGRKDEAITLTAAVRGTPQDASAQLAPALAFVRGRADLVIAYSDSFRAPNGRYAHAVAVVRRRDAKRNAA